MLDCRIFRNHETGEAHARRGAEILSAAERCFVRAGFHRTTIQNIAADAGMSVGNVYRYFASKDAVVEALVKRDQARIAEDFDRLGTDNLMGAFTSLMRRQIIDSGRGQAVLWLEICAEAARNPVIAAVTRAHKDIIAAHLRRFFTRAIAQQVREHGGYAADAKELAELTMALFSGIMVTQAAETEPGSTEANVDHMLAVVCAALDGRIRLGLRTELAMATR